MPDACGVWESRRGGQGTEEEFCREAPLAVGSSLGSLLEVVDHVFQVLRCSDLQVR